MVSFPILSESKIGSVSDRLDGLAKRRKEGAPQTLEDWLQEEGDFEQKKAQPGKKQVKLPSLASALCFQGCTYPFCFTQIQSHTILRINDLQPNRFVQLKLLR